MCEQHTPWARGGRRAGQRWGCGPTHPTLQAHRDFFLPAGSSSRLPQPPLTHTDCAHQAPTLQSLSPPLPVPCAPPGQVSACSRPTRALHTSAANSSCPFAWCSLPTSFFKGPRFKATSFLTQEGETIWRQLRGGGPNKEWKSWLLTADLPGCLGPALLLSEPQFPHPYNGVCEACAI